MCPCNSRVCPCGSRATAGLRQLIECRKSLPTPIPSATIGYIQRHEFDPKRILEYYSRILLGVVSGGMVVLLVENLSGDGNQTYHLSAAALVLLAGYNTDFLFSAIERIAAAILPKVGPETVQRQPPPAVAGGDVALIKDLVTQLAAATDPNDKKAIQALIDKVTGRL